MTALGTDAPNAVGLVYIAAFGIEEGESLGALLSQGPPTPALAHQLIDNEGFARLTEDDFVNHFAANATTTEVHAGTWRWSPARPRSRSSLRRQPKPHRLPPPFTDPRLVPSRYIIPVPQRSQYAPARRQLR